jgi:hypothetical protein
VPNKKRSLDARAHSKLTHSILLPHLRRNRKRHKRRCPWLTPRNAYRKRCHRPLPGQNVSRRWLHRPQCDPPTHAQRKIRGRFFIRAHTHKNKKFTTNGHVQVKPHCVESTSFPTASISAIETIGLHGPCAMANKHYRMRARGAREFAWWHRVVGSMAMSNNAAD